LLFFDFISNSRYILFGEEMDINSRSLTIWVW